MQSAEFHTCPPGSAWARMMRKSISRKMEGWHREVLEAAPDAIVGAGGATVLVRPQTEKQFGSRRDELLGQQVKSIIPAEFAEQPIADDLRSAEDALGLQ
jgi:PAS domain-containing protein